MMAGACGCRAFCEGESFHACRSLPLPRNAPLERVGNLILERRQSKVWIDYGPFGAKPKAHYKLVRVLSDKGVLYG
jgi:hypothetical protein